MLQFIQDENGATAIEYGLISALIAVAIIGALGTLGGTLSDQFNELSNTIDGVETSASSSS